MNFPKQLLLGKPIQSDMYSGYVNVTSDDFLFYVLAEAHEGGSDDTPIIVYSGGGPGCSAMEGAVIETGPYMLYDVKAGSGMFPMRLTANVLAWNRLAHVLYVDQPRYVGFSYGSGPAVRSSTEAGLDMVQFLRGWRRTFPEHARRKLIFASEAYGSHYVTAWAEAVLDHNARASDQLELRGIVVGNGIVNDSLQGFQSLVQYQRRERLIPEGAQPTAWADAQVVMMKHLGYVPNAYDYRLQNQECCGCTGYNYKVWSDWMMRDAVTAALNVCPGAGQEAFQGCQGGCVDLGDFDQDGTRGQRTAQTLGRLLDEGIPVVLHYGMLDTAVNYVGGLAATLSLQWRGTKDFADAPLEYFKIGGAVAGQRKSFSGLTWMQIQAAGHMAAVDNSLSVLYAVGEAVRLAKEDQEEEHQTFARFT